METGTESQVSEPTSAVEAPEAVAPNGQEGAGAVSPSIDPKEYETIKQEHGQLREFYSKLEQITNADPAFRKELERAWKGLPPAVQQQIKQEQKAQEPKSNKEIAEVREALKQLQEERQVERQETMRKEKFAEVQSETNATFERFKASPEDQKEFWNRYGNMIRNEAFGYMQNNPGLDPARATSMAYSRHSANIAAEYITLMEDKMVSFYGNQLKERQNPLRGIGTPADKVGKNGVTPTTQERFMNAIKNERNPEKRAEMYSAYAQQMGIPIDELFRGKV